MNAFLKEIGIICGIHKPISTHTDRHTFATTVALENNMPLEVVSKNLGRSSSKKNDATLCENNGSFGSKEYGED